MSESIQESIKRTASRGGWKSYFLHALLMLFATWPVFIAITAAAEHQIPTSLRAVVMKGAEAIGFHFIPLVISWAVLRFSKVAGWITWVLLVGLMSWLQFTQAAA